MTRRVRVLPLCAAAVLALSACGGGTSSSTSSEVPVPETSSWPSSMTPSPGGSSTSPSSTSTSTSASPTSSSTSTTPKSTAGAGEEGWGDEAKVKSQAKASAPAVKVASDLADDLVKHRSSPKKKWWSTIKPALSKSGQQQMQSLGPKKVGFAKITGKARAIVTEADMGERYVSVGVPTDKGIYLFLAEKQGSTWKIASVSRMNGQPDG